MSDLFIALAAPVVLPHVEGPVIGFVNCDTGRGPVSLPVTEGLCIECNHPLTAGPVAGVCRVSGDSRYGYEAVHVGCEWDDDPEVVDALLGHP